MYISTWGLHKCISTILKRFLSAQFHNIVSTDLVQLRAPSVIRNISFYDATSGVLMRKL